MVSRVTEGCQYIRSGFTVPAGPPGGRVAPSERTAGDLRRSGSGEHKGVHRSTRAGRPVRPAGRCGSGADTGGPAGPIRVRLRPVGPRPSTEAAASATADARTGPAGRGITSPLLEADVCTAHGSPKALSTGPRPAGRCGFGTAVGGRSIRIPVRLRNRKERPSGVRPHRLQGRNPSTEASAPTSGGAHSGSARRETAYAAPGADACAARMGPAATGGATRTDRTGPSGRAGAAEPPRHRNTNEKDLP